MSPARAAARLAALAVLAACLAGPLAAGASARAIMRVYNGAPVTVPPYMGFLVGEDSSGVFTCGGTAIAPNVLLTAAHCVTDSKTGDLIPRGHLGVVFGTDDPIAAINAKTAHLDLSADTIVPTGYRSLADGGGTYDIALVRLSSPAPGTIQVLKDRPDLYRAGTSAFVMGWGKEGGTKSNLLPSNLLAAPMPIEPYGVCARQIAGYNPYVMLCAGDGVRAAPCEGDSGGPLTVRDPATGTVYEVGVVSFGSECDEQGSVSVFANVANGVLGSFISKYAPQFQQTADGGPAAGASPPVQVTESSDNLPAPRLSFSDAYTSLIRVIGARSHGRVAGLTVHCSRGDAQRFACKPTWRTRTTSFRATARVSAAGVTVRGRRAARGCVARKGFARCARAFSWSA